MSIAKWVLIGLVAYGALSSIATIGKPRKPSTPTEVVIATVISAVVAWLVVIA